MLFFLIYCPIFCLFWSGFFKQDFVCKASLQNRTQNKSETFFANFELCIGLLNVSFATIQRFLNFNCHFPANCNNFLIKICFKIFERKNITPAAGTATGQTLGWKIYSLTLFSLSSSCSACSAPFPRLFYFLRSIKNSAGARACLASYKNLHQRLVDPRHARDPPLVLLLRHLCGEQDAAFASHSKSPTHIFWKRHQHRHQHRRQHQQQQQHLSLRRQENG